MEDLIGLLRIKVKKGFNLVKRDSLSSDPCVVITMGQQKLKTRVVQNNCNPEWNDELTIGVKHPNHTLNLQVYDEDTFSGDDRMGDAEIDFHPFLEAIKIDSQSLIDGHEITKVEPNDNNCLAEQSSIVFRNGKVTQDMILKLRNIKSGLVEIQLNWIDVPNSEGS